MIKKNLILAGFFTSTAAFSSPWVIDVSPYMWATSVKGDVSLGNRTAHISESFLDLLKILDFGGMLWLDAHNDRLGFFYNGYYSKLSTNKVALDTLVTAASQLVISSAGASYRFSGAPESPFFVEPYIGARYTATRSSVSASQFGTAGLKEDWTDAIIGSRFNYTLSTASNIEGAADYGQASRSSSYNVMLLAGYQSAIHFKRTRFYLGYRYLHQNYGHGEGASLYRWKMNIFGPVAGFRVRF